jgi:putative tryptophan/tyrosine transport system substrate-binding protein
MRPNHLRRRDFVTLLGGAAVAWPLAARGQQPNRVRRVGVLMTARANDAQGQAEVTAFRQELEKLRWTEGRNVRIDVRFAAADPDLIQSYAAELVRLAPEVILAQNSLAVTAVLRASPSMPIVFVQIVDPVGSGFVASLAHPGGNVTGFSPAEFSMAGKMLEVFKDVAPHISRVAVILNPEQVPGVKMLQAIEAVAGTIAVHATAAGVHDAPEIEHTFDAFAGQSNFGLIVLPSAPTTVHRKLIIELAARHRLPAVYAFPYFVREGGLVSYGIEDTDQYRQAASYVDRILRGTKPSDLPVQQPTKFELVVNLKTARALDLTIGREFLFRADEVIE